jgi:predicted NAD/FAD-binding protein
MKIAIIGSGISGLVAANRLSDRHEVTLFEADDRLGGHTATKDVILDGQQYAIDTGFIVFNDKTYPNFKALLQELGVYWRDTSMGFSVRCDATGLEYSGSNLNTLFAQRRNLLSPYFLSLVRDILRFNRQALDDLQDGRLADGVTLAEYLKENRYSRAFTNHYLAPMAAAIWSSALETVLRFPVLFFVRFFKNHGLLQINDRPQWHTVVGGSRAYIEPLCQPFSDRIRLNCPVQQVRRCLDGVTVSTREFGHERYDHVVIATHSDQALAMLEDPSKEEQSVLGATPYIRNSVVLHTDESLLPRKRSTWSSWNYRLQPGRWISRPSRLSPTI